MSKSYYAKDAYQGNDVAAKYDEERFGSIKGELTNYLEKNAIDKALGQLAPNAKILDVPCGTGRATEWLLQKGFQVNGFDISEEMIAQAKLKLNKYKNLEQIYVGDATNINLEDETFDCVVSVRLMGHIPPEERARMLSEFRRLSKQYVVVTMYHSNCAQRYARTSRDLFSKTKRSMWFPVSKRDMKSELSEAGLEIVGIYPIAKYVSETWVILAKKMDVQTLP